MTGKPVDLMQALIDSLAGDPPGPRPQGTSVSTLDDIAAHGNRGHAGFAENNHIVCADGYELSVLAGGGTYCTPRPANCLCWFYGTTEGVGRPLPFEVAHDFPGPYTHVEVMVGDPKPRKKWKKLDVGGVYSRVPVEMVRALIERHGGEAS